MADATVANETTSATIRAEEAAHFGKLAAQWWDPAGSSAMLHRLNPVRLAFIRAALDQHWAADPRGIRPLAGKRALDVGCGAGLLCEPLARLGAAVAGVDAAAENIAAAKEHAAGGGLLAPLPLRGGAGGRALPHSTASTDNPPTQPSPLKEGGLISYHHGELAALGLGRFDLVTSMEVIEHVADKPAFVSQLAAHLADGGLMVLSTPNRTARSRLLLVEGAERMGLVPRGTHHWDDFITPDELADLLAGAGLTMGTPQGIAWTPTKGLHLSTDMALNYIVTATAA
jgi:2-polyprenyl-6-hydroxyphenyl methylase/3-demethylubiquinone-9 3-methyltransferase